MISMLFHRRMTVSLRMACACAIAFVAVSAVSMAADTLEQRKREVARASLDRLGRPDAGVLIDNASQAEALTDIRVDGLGPQALLTVETTGEPAYKVFTTEEGRKVVLDVTGAVNLQAGKVFSPAQDTIVRQVRTSLFAVEPQYISRVVADLTGPGQYTVAREGCRICLTITGKGANPSGQTVETIKTAERLNKTKATLEAVRKEVQEKRVRKEWMRDSALRVGLAAHSMSKTGAELASRVREGFLTLAGRQQAVTPQPAEQRVEYLARDLEMVKAAEIELRMPPLARLAQVAPASQPSAEAATPDSAATGNPAEPPQTTETPAASDNAGVSAETKPAAESSPSDPPPPPKREEGAESASGGAAAIGRMKQLISGIVGAPPNPVEAGLTSPAVVDAQNLPREAKSDSASKAGAGGPESNEPPPFIGNPMEQIVNIDLREMDLTNVVALLAQKAQINVIAGTELKGVVTASLKNITLRKAIDTVLRMNNLGIVEEEGIYRIIPYEDALAAKRKTLMVKLDSAKVEELQKTLQEVVKGTPDDNLVSISVDKQTNTLILAGPDMRILELEKLARDLDVSKPATPTITEAIKINNADPEELLKLVAGIQTPEIGKAAVDVRSRMLVITDVPVVLDQIRDLIAKVDMPVKQVTIEAMVVDAVLSDNAETGIDWIYKAVMRRDALGNLRGDLAGLGMENDATGSALTSNAITAIPMVGRLSFALLSSHADIQGAIAGQVKANNAKLLANPTVVTVENKKANINITREIPYTQYTQSTTGPPMATTAFKEVGIIMTVTPNVSHDNHVISDIDVKESTSTEVVNDIPVEAKRQAQTTLRTKNGQTIYIGGLRQLDDTTSVSKTPILGDIPIMNLLFRSNSIKKQRSELLVFLTCTVLPDEVEPLPAEHQAKYDELGRTPFIPNSQHTLIHNTINPGEFRDPAWKYRRPVEDGPLIPKPEKKAHTKRPQRIERVD